MTDLDNSRSTDAAVFSWCGSGGVRADSDLVFYVDEAGNTGINHLDTAQPYYVTGGWLTRPADEAQFKRLVSEACATMNMSELKGSQMLKTTVGMRAAYALILNLLSFATPISIVIEKKFALRIRLVEDFVMHPAGPFFGNGLPPRAVGRGFVETLSILSDSDLLLANQYIRQPSPELARKCASALEAAMIDAGQRDLAGVIRGSIASPERWWTPDEIRKRSLAPNVLAFNTLLQSLELLGIECGRTITVVHDELPSLQAVYEFYQDYATNRDLAYKQMFKEAGCPGRLSHVSAPAFRNSKTEPAIQAADLLCGATTALLGSLADWKDEFPEERRMLAIILLWGFVEPDLRRYYRFIGSEAVGMGFGQKLVDLFGEGDAQGAAELGR